MDELIDRLAFVRVSDNGIPFLPSVFSSFFDDLALAPTLQSACFERPPLRLLLQERSPLALLQQVRKQ